MSARPQRATGAGEVVATLSAHIRPALVDRMIELYCDWRTECAAVQAAYERFLDASRPDRADAFAAYVAALDQEQSACEFYAQQVRLIQLRCTARWCARGESPATKAWPTNWAADWSFSEDLLVLTFSKRYREHK